jgi:hypothetical protein
MRRLAARVPRPKLHMIRFHGVLAPHAATQDAIFAEHTTSSREQVIRHAKVSAGTRRPT